MSMSVNYQFQRWQYWKQFSKHLGASQTISGRRTNQNAWGIINKRERSFIIRLKWWITPILLSPVVRIYVFMCMCSYIPACACVLYECMRCVSSSCMMWPQSLVHSIHSTNRLHHLPPINQATCSTQGYSHNHKTTTAKTFNEAPQIILCLKLFALSDRLL